MRESNLRHMIRDVKEGRLGRREFVARMAALGIAAPMAGTLLMHAGVATAQSSSFQYKPTKRGGGGVLKMLFWQAPTLLNPHFAAGTKDQEACRLFYEPLAGWDAEGNLRAILASEIPSNENGGVSKDGLSVIWKLKPNVTWHDGRRFSADDCVFTWRYCSDPATTAVNITTFQGVKVEKVDDLTIRVSFARPTPFWADAFVGARGVILPKHIFESYIGAPARDAGANGKPVGTGPYKFTSFKPGDFLSAAINPNYHAPNRPHFDSVEIKGGGDAVSAARAVLQAAEYDFAPNLQVEDEILRKLEEGGKGRAEFIESGNIEFIAIQHADPFTDVDGERSHPNTRHPILSDKAVRDALNLLVDRGAIEKYIYGRAGLATANFINNPKRFRSQKTKWEFNLAAANKVLDAAGWTRGADGVRTKGGRKLQLTLQTSINAPRQKAQAVVKQAFQKAGIALDLKQIAASVFFSTDPGNGDTYQHFYSDLEMIQATVNGPDPALLTSQFCSWAMASKPNRWQGRNITRWKSEAYDRAFDAAQQEIDPVKRAELFIRMNELVVEDVAVIPVVYRPSTAGVRADLRAPLSGWDNNLWLISDWYREV